jgi:hypothetical protein
MMTLAALAVGCSTERSLNQRSIEIDIAAQLFPEHPGLVSDVACPSVDEPMPGEQVTCVARLGAQNADVAVTLGGTIDALTATAALVDRFVDVQSVAALLAETFTDEVGISTTVDCGQPILVVEPNEAIVCTASDPSGRSRLFDVQIDDGGELSLRIR